MKNKAFHAIKQRQCDNEHVIIITINSAVVLLVIALLLDIKIMLTTYSEGYCM